MDALKKGAQVVVGTPGRLAELDARLQPGTRT
jgi:superfamily II DNA/RNA helicase